MANRQSNLTLRNNCKRLIHEIDGNIAPYAGSSLGRFLSFHAPDCAFGVAGMEGSARDFHHDFTLGGGVTSLEP